MRWAAVLILLLLPGCFTELLVSSNETTRNIACDAIDPAQEIVLVHHGAPPIDVVQARDAWARAMAAAIGKDGALIQYEVVDDLPEGVPDPLDWAIWLDERPVLGAPMFLHVLWVADVGAAGHTMEVVRPGFLAINATAIEEAVASGRDGQRVGEGILVHGLGHLLGVVNRGIPLHAPDSDGREHGGHAPRGVMAEGWHRVHDLPRNATTDRYSDVVAEDWNAAARNPKVCP